MNTSSPRFFASVESIHTPAPDPDLNDPVPAGSFYFYMLSMGAINQSCFTTRFMATLNKSF